MDHASQVPHATEHSTIQTSYIWRANKLKNNGKWLKQPRFPILRFNDKNFKTLKPNKCNNNQIW